MGVVTPGRALALDNKVSIATVYRTVRLLEEKGILERRDFGGGLSQAEVDYLRREEWARTADDVLWRRTKLGLRLDAAQQAALAGYMGG